MTASDFLAVREAIIADLEIDEGERLKPYTDTVGKLTIGYGRNLTDNGIRESEAVIMLENDLTEAVVECQTRFSWFDSKDGPRQRVLIELMFNMGPDKLLQFKNMLAAIELDHNDIASKELLRSIWAVQVGLRRSHRLADLLQSV